jgi:hypothetical protein
MFRPMRLLAVSLAAAAFRAAQFAAPDGQLDAWHSGRS